MSTFKCDYATFRKVTGEFIKELPNITDLEVLDSCFKCVQLHYLGLETDKEHELVSAAAALRIVSDEYLKVVASLLRTR